MLIIEKYGGSSVSTIAKIKKIAKHLKKLVQNENKILVVVSAMGKTTNKLLSLAQKISKTPNKREQDVLISTGEQQSIALLCIALKELGLKAISLCGFQAKILTSSNFSKAFIQNIKIESLKNLFKKFGVIVVAGFQGIDKQNNITTLGRGGSDTTAVALSAKLRCPCFVYTDVECVFSANPKSLQNPKPLHNLNINSCLEMASAGAKVLDTRCLEIAKKFSVPLFLGKSLEEDKSKGTFITMKNDFEKPEVTAICEKENLCIIKICKAQKDALKILEILKKENQNLSSFCFSKNVLSFLIAKNDAKNIEITLKKALKNLKIKILENFCQITLVGFGFSTHPEIVQKMLSKLNEKNIFPKQISVTETVVCFVLKQSKQKIALKTLAKTFGVI